MGKVYFYNYIRILQKRRSGENKDWYRKQQNLIVKKTQEILASNRLNSYNKRIYDLYVDLFNWISTSYLSVNVFVNKLGTEVAKLSAFIDTVYEAEIISQKLSESKTNNLDVNQHLDRLTLENSEKLNSAKEALAEVKQSLEEIMIYQVTLTVVGKITNVKEFIGFNVDISSLLNTLDKIFSKAKELKKILENENKTKEIGNLIKKLTPSYLAPYLVGIANKNIENSFLKKVYTNANFSTGITIAQKINPNDLK
jgi:hypothetical protein